MKMITKMEMNIGEILDLAAWLEKHGLKRTHRVVNRNVAAVLVPRHRPELRLLNRKASLSISPIMMFGNICECGETVDTVVSKSTA